jgi:GNAT superfamily N-acetyltransferase
MPDAPRLRRARSGEREDLEGLQRRASLVWEDYRADLLAHPDAIELPAAQIEDGCVFVAEQGGRTLGFGVVLPREDGEAELDGLFVEPDSWGSGVGRSLIGEAARLGLSRGSRWLCVIANPRARGFYEACGFELTGETSTRFGSGYLMRLALDGSPGAGDPR